MTLVRLRSKFVTFGHGFKKAGSVLFDICVPGTRQGLSKSDYIIRYLHNWVVLWLCIVFTLGESPRVCSRYSNYTSNFEEVDGAYWFRVVRPCFRSKHACHILRTVHAKVLKFHIWIPHGKIADTFYLVRVISLSGDVPLWQNLKEIWCLPYLVNRAC